MTTVRFAVDSPRPPEAVQRDLIDFSDRRPRLWPAIDPRVFRVHDTGDGWAEATEGSDVMGGIWARERYEWRPGFVRATIVESNFWHPGGTWEASITPDGNGGSHVAVVRDRRAKVAKARVLEVMLALTGSRLLASQLAEAPAISGVARG